MTAGVKSGRPDTLMQPSRFSQTCGNVTRVVSRLSGSLHERGVVLPFNLWIKSQSVRCCLFGIFFLAAKFENTAWFPK